MATYKPKKKIDNNGTLEDVKIPIESVAGLSDILDTIPNGSPIIDLGTITENPESLTNSVLNANKTSGLYTFKYGGTNYIMACYQSGPRGGRQNITYYSSSTQYNITRNWDVHGFYSVTKKEVAYSDNIPTTTSQLTNDSDFATNSSVDTKIANIVNSAPEALDTLGELATALETHEDAYDALLETVGKKANKSDINALVATTEQEFNSFVTIENKGKTISYNGDLYIVNQEQVSTAINVGDTIQTLYFNTNIEPDFSTIEISEGGASLFETQRDSQGAPSLCYANIGLISDGIMPVETLYLLLDDNVFRVLYATDDFDYFGVLSGTKGWNVDSYDFGRGVVVSSVSQVDKWANYVSTQPFGGDVEATQVCEEELSKKADIDFVQDEFKKKGVHFISNSDITMTAGTSTPYNLSEKWVVNGVNGITKPFDGMLIAIRLPSRGTTPIGIVLSLDNGNTYNALIICSGSSTQQLYQAYKSDSIVLFTFNAKISQRVYLESGVGTTITGCWQTADRDENYLVQQTNSSANEEDPVLTKSNASSSSTQAGQTRFNPNVTINHSTGTLSATAFKENGVSLSDKYVLKNDTSSVFKNLGLIDTWVGDPYGFEFDAGVTWNEAYTIFDKDENGLVTGEMAHRVPILAGEGIEFETDIDNNVVKINATVSGGGSPLVEITYNELKALRDGGQLVAGQYYCITDYECTTSQINTRATASTNFDIIVQALSNSVLSENASVRPRGEKPTLKKSVLTNKQVKSRVIIYYREYIDYHLDAGLDADYRSGKDYFVDFDYIENNVGEIVPVIYKTDAAGLDPTMANYNSEFDGADYADSFFYEGAVEINGETYDKWRLINEDEDIFTWDSAAKSYVYTNQIVDNGAITIDPFLYEVETDEYRLDSSAVNICYFEFIDFPDGEYDLQPIEDKKFAAYEYMADNNGNIVPVLHDWDSDGGTIGYNENYYYDGKVTIDGTLYDRWRKIEIDSDDFGWDTTGKAYYYTNVIVEATASNSDIKFQSWEIKYSLDNDKTRFWWAMDGQMIVNLESGFSNGTPLTRQPSFDGKGTGEYQYAWGTQADVEDEDGTNFIFSKNEMLVNGEDVYNVIQDTYLPAEVVSGKGVIYYMKDEYDNECPYDFKNIQFKRDDTYYYTFSWVDEDGAVKDLSIVGNTELTNDEGQITGCYSNKIGIASLYGVGKYLDNATNLGMVLNNNVFISTYDFEGGVYYGCSSNILGNNCRNNTFGNNCDSNIFGDGCTDNSFEYGGSHNSFGGDCSNNSFGGFGYHNTFGGYCTHNTFGMNCDHNTFGDCCCEMTLGDGCANNTFGSGCNENTLTGYCTSNTFGNGCQDITFGDMCDNNIVDNGVRGAQPQPATGSQTMQGVHIHYGVTGQFTVVRGANYTQDVRTANDVTITV
jgi:hypothetical protein